MTEERFEITVESTMIGPLFARAYYGRLYPDILDVPEADILISKIKDIHADSKKEFMALEEVIDEFLGLTLLIRARIFDDAVRKFIATNPKSTVVNLGCGLETSFYRVDNGEIKWYDLDLPDAIDYRLGLIPEGERNRCIAKSVFDRSWFNEIEHIVEYGIIFIVGGLFVYFDEKDVANLLNDMANYFAGGELMFDASSKIGNAIVNRRLDDVGTEGVRFKLAIGNPRKQLSTWSTRIEVIESFPMFSRLPRNPKWRRKTRYLMKISDLISAAKVIHLRFG